MLQSLRLLTAGMLAWIATCGAASAQGNQPASAGSLPKSITQALARAQVPTAYVAAYAHPVGAAQPSLSWNPDKPMNPASVMKLVTTYAGLELLGPQFAWRTQLFAHGELRDGVLQGDLAIKGGGDPRLTIEYFTALIDALRATGLREIRGDLIFDRGYFEGDTINEAQFDQEPMRPYNVGPYAVLANFKAVKFQFVPDPSSNTVTVEPEPKLGSVALHTAIRLRNGRCGDWRSGIKTEVKNSAREAQVAFSGVMSEACGPQHMYLSVLSHPEFVFAMFKSLWTDQGGTITGSWKEATVPDGAKPLHTHYSPPLSEVVRDINKFSNNVMARQLYLTLSAETMKLPGRADRSDRAIRSLLHTRGIAIPGLLLENGSGLSRNERLSARGISTLLLAAHAGAHREPLIDSLPIVGVDGTTRSRLQGDNAAGQAHIKTGGLNDVSSIAGYVRARDGRMFAVAFIANHANAIRTYPAQDAFIKWVHAGANGE